ncbi:MAG: hypothetical protein KDK08_11335 [Rhizobiaceae bacterium]|nr:hypothetical protein [Rhizobiaceae bacterium]
MSDTIWTSDLTIGELKHRLDAFGFFPDAASIAEIHAALPLLRDIQARLRREYRYGDETSEVFRP